MLRSLIRKTCKLEYYIREMPQADKREIICLIDNDGENNFDISDIRAVTEFKNVKPASGDSFAAFEYQTALYFYTNASAKFESIFRRINELFIKNNVQPIFPDPTNLDECLDIRDDMIEPMSYERANEFFGVENYRAYRPPVYKKQALWLDLVM